MSYKLNFTQHQTNTSISQASDSINENSLVYCSDWINSELEISLDDTIDSGISYSTSTPSISHHDLSRSRLNYSSLKTKIKMENEETEFQTVKVTTHDFTVECDNSLESEHGERSGKRIKEDTIWTKSPLKKLETTLESEGCRLKYSKKSENSILNTTSPIETSTQQRTCRDKTLSHNINSNNKHAHTSTNKPRRKFLLKKSAHANTIEKTNYAKKESNNVKFMNKQCES